MSSTENKVFGNIIPPFITDVEADDLWVGKVATSLTRYSTTINV